MMRPAHPRISRALALAFCALLAAAAAQTYAVPRAAAPRAGTPRAFTTAAPPSWVDIAEPVGEGAKLASRAGVLDLLDDEQQRVTATGSEHFYRHVTRVLTTVGLEEMSQLSLDFDPSYERLVVHWIRILRNGKQIDAFDPAAVNVVQKEDELDEQLYNGMLSAIVFLEDLRPGDVVDYAYSIDGENPVFDGAFTGSMDLAAFYPIRTLRRRILCPSDRRLAMRYTHDEIRPAVRELDGETEYLWVRNDVAALDEEENAPSWYLPGDAVLVSEFGSWGDVVRWALPLYGAEGPLTPEMAEQVEAWRAASASDEERFVAALRFVQDEVRYLGIELGPGSHRPNTPAVCFARRFGDCKDKSLLLVTLLGALGIEAHPALVNTELGRAVDVWPASPLAFDHVVVKATVGGKTIWVDPTIAQQRGRLARLAPLDYERALVLAEGVDSLESIPRPPSSGPTTIVKEVYTATETDEPAALEVTTTYTGSDADAVRYSFSQQSTSDVARGAINSLAEVYPEIEEAAPIEIHDDESENALTVVERYRILNFWRDDTREIVADVISGAAAIPRGGRRVAPLKVEHPVDAAQTIELHLPAPVHVDEESGTIEGTAVALDYSRSSKEGVVTLDYRYRTLADSVAPSKVSEHIATLERIQKLTRYAVARDAGLAWPGEALTAAGLLALLATLGAWALRRRRGWNRPVEAPAAGGAPGAPIDVPHGEPVERYVARQRCACGASLAPRGSDLLTYDGRKLTVVGLACPACGASRDLYLSTADSRG